MCTAERADVTPSRWLAAPSGACRSSFEDWEAGVMTCLPQATGMFSAQGPFDCADFKGGVGWRLGGCEADTRSPRAFPGLGVGC